MKETVLFALILFCFAGTNAQVKIQPLPEKDYDIRIQEFVDNLKVIDTHEHLSSSPSNSYNWISHDFTWLINIYASDDIISSGMPKSLFYKTLGGSLSVPEKWELIKPYWEKSFNTAYCRNTLYAAKKLFGIDEFNDSTILILSDKIKIAYQNDKWFYEILDRSNIEFVIQDRGDRNFKGDKFRYVVRFDQFIRIRDKNSIENLSKGQESTIQTFDDLLTTLGKSFEEAHKEGVVGVKSGLAYSRILHYEHVEREDAEAVFNTLMTDHSDCSFKDIKLLQDFMMHQVIQLAEAYGKPIIIHTGLQTGNGNVIENSKPTHLVNLFQEYPDVRFVLYHGSYPYGGELATLAKNFSNVYIDLSWLYIISPSYAERYLHEWLETVPVNKIMGFGGDLINIENVYAHIYFAKQIISKVLIEKVKSGYFSESEAKKVAQMILYENARNFYDL